MRAPTLGLAAGMLAASITLAPSTEAAGENRREAAQLRLERMAHEALRAQLSFCLMELSEADVADHLPATFVLSGALAPSESGELQLDWIRVEGGPAVVQEACSNDPFDAARAWWFPPWEFDCQYEAQDIPRRFVPELIEVEAAVEVTELTCHLQQDTPIVHTSYDPREDVTPWQEGLSDLWYFMDSCSASLQGCRSLMARGCSAELMSSACEAEAPRIGELARDDVVTALGALPPGAFSPRACPELRARLVEEATAELVGAAEAGDVERARALATALIVAHPAMAELDVFSKDPSRHVRQGDLLDALAGCMAENWESVAHVRKFSGNESINLGGKLFFEDPFGERPMGECMTRREAGQPESLQGQPLQTGLMDLMALVYVAEVARKAPDGSFRAYLKLTDIGHWTYANLIGPRTREAMATIIASIESLPGFADELAAHEARLAARRASEEAEQLRQAACEAYARRGEWMREFGHHDVDDFVADLAACGVLRKRVGAGCPAEVYARGVRLFCEHNLRPALEIAGPGIVEDIAEGSCSGPMMTTSLSYGGVSISFDPQTCASEVLGWCD